jgi:hypothetical protein
MKAAGTVLLLSFILAAIVAFYVATEFGWGLPSADHIQSYHPDEQNVTYSLRNMHPENLDFNPRFFGNPTFYTYQVGALALAARTAGILPREMNEAYALSNPGAVTRFYLIGRLLSFAYAVLSVILVYGIAKLLTGDLLLALTAAVIFVALPITAVHSHYMTVNASAVFWSLAAILFALKIQDRPSWRNYILAALFAGLAISTKMNNAFLPFAILAAHLTAPGDAKWLRRLAAARLWVAALVCIAAFVAGSPYYVLSYESVRANPHNQMNLAALLDFHTPLATVLKDFWQHVSAACGPVMGAILLASLPAAFIVGPRRRLAPILAVAVPFLLLAVKSGWWAFPSRMWPLFALLAILVPVLALRKPRSVAVRVVLMLVLAAGALSSMTWNVAYNNLMATEHVRAEASRWITDSIPQGSSVIVLDTPYFDDPDVIYENALHPDFVRGRRYNIVNLHGDLDALPKADGQWLVIPERFLLPVRRGKGLWLNEYAAANGFYPIVTFERPFAAFGWKLRDWVPADMVQAYPVYIFKRKS